MMTLTYFERLAICTAIGLSSGTAAEIRAGMRILDKIDFPDAYKSGKQTDDNGLLLLLPAEDYDLQDVFELTDPEKQFIKQRLSQITGLPMNRRSVSLLDKFGV